MVVEAFSPRITCWKCDHIHMLTGWSQMVEISSSRRLSSMENRSEVLFHRCYAMLDKVSSNGLHEDLNGVKHNLYSIILFIYLCVIAFHTLSFLSCIILL